MATTYLKLFEVIGSYWLLLVDIVRFEKVNISSTKSTNPGKGTTKQQQIKAQKESTLYRERYP